MSEKNVLILFWTNTGNTEKVAFSIKNGVEDAGARVNMVNTAKSTPDIDFLEYDLVCIGTPSFSWMPPEDLDNYIQNKFKSYEKEGHVKLGAPKIPKKNCLLFCTYSGPHTGKNEAIPAVKYLGQYFEHIGFNIVDEWYILSEFHKSEKISTEGKMGDIRGLPTEKTLKKLEQKAENIIQKI